MRYSDRFNSVIEEIFGWASSNKIVKSSESMENKSDWGEQSQLDEHLLRLGDTYIQLSNYRSAMHCFLEAARINPENAMALNRLVVIPSYFFERDINQNIKRISALDKVSLEKMALNDAFRQTFIGGPLILSKLVTALPNLIQKEIFESVQNLDNDYFSSNGGILRDHGPLNAGDYSFFWMINRCYSSLTKPKHTFPILIITTMGEHEMLKALFQNTRG